jgi:bla regulator protein BlaR1
MSLATLAPLGNHVWQSTVFATMVGLLVLVFRRNQAHVRHWLWLIASAKFLVPFAALVAIGRQFGWLSSASVVQPDMSFVVDAISQPFFRPGAAAASQLTTPSVPVLPILFLAIWLAGFVMHLLAWRVRWRRVAAVVRDASALEDGRELDALRRLEKTFGMRHRTAVVTSDTSFEPGVFGILSPVLVWPRCIGKRLSDQQLEAILAHELCHVRRRDNLAVAVHMVVESIFWFHPVVWWLERRLVEERERACDEEVIKWGSDPQFYAEGILKTCDFCIESPLIVAGVMGSDLKKRIEAIMRCETGRELKAWKKLLLTAIGIATIAAPISIGILSVPPLRAQSLTDDAGRRRAFDAASIKLNKSGGPSNRDFGAGGRFTARNTPLRLLIQLAYRIQDFQLSGKQDVLNDRFDIVAKTEGNPPVNEMQSMLRTLLKDRFKLTVRGETKQLPVYALVMARKDRTMGVDLRRSGTECAPIRIPASFPNAPPPPPPPGPQAPPGPRADQDPNRFGQGCGGMLTPGLISARKMTMTQLANLLSRFLNRSVMERTGLTGDFDVDLVYTPDQMPTAAAGGPPPVTGPPDGPSIFTATQEQLGLRLQSTKGPVEIVVIDSVQQPTPD